MCFVGENILLEYKREQARDEDSEREKTAKDRSTFVFHRLLITTYDKTGVTNCYLSNLKASKSRRPTVM